MTNVLAVLDSLGLVYTIRGDEATACCPAHADRHPSWSVNLSTGMHHCFSCGFGGGVERLVAQVTGKGSSDARMHVLRTRARHGPGWAPRVPVRPAEPVWRYTEAALWFFDSPPAQALSQRHLTASACDQYEIRWDSAKSAWIIPIRDIITGELRGWQEKNDRSFRNRPASVEKSRALFGLRAVPDGGRPVLVESPLDAARLHAAGFGSGVSSYGVSVSSYQLSPLLNRTGQIVLALDNDAAGIRETERLVRGLHLRSRSLIFNYGDSKAKDIGEMDDDQVRWGLEHAIRAIDWVRARV